MTKYEKSVIYKIQHLEKPELIYIGSTTNYNSRINQHKSRLRNHTDKEHGCLKYCMIRDNGGWDSFSMTPIMKFPCKDKIDLLIKEEQVRQEYKATYQIRAHVPKKVEKERPAMPFLALKTRQWTEADLVDG